MKAVSLSPKIIPFFLVVFIVGACGQIIDVLDNTSHFASQSNGTITIENSEDTIHLATASIQSLSVNVLQFVADNHVTRQSKALFSAASVGAVPQ